MNSACRPHKGNLLALIPSLYIRKTEAHSEVSFVFSFLKYKNNVAQLLISSSPLTKASITYSTINNRFSFEFTLLRFQPADSMNRLLKHFVLSVN